MGYASIRSRAASFNKCLAASFNKCLAASFNEYLAARLNEKPALRFRDQIAARFSRTRALRVTQLHATAFFAASMLIAPQMVEAGEKVGVASAVTPRATSKAPGAATTTLKIGKSVFYNERIVTSDKGVVQVLLIDGSTFTVGPRSNLIIDKFVYDPRKGTGAMTATLSKGALRFVGGKLSKSEPGVKVKTPAGELTVRGGIFQGIVESPNRAVFAFVYGKYLSLARGGKRQTLRQSGNLFAIGNAGPAITRRTTAADANLILAAISGRGGARVYKTRGNPWPFYYGISPTGPYPDLPNIDARINPTLPLRLRRVPEPKVMPVYRPSPMRPDRHMNTRRPTKPPVQITKPTYDTVTGPGFSTPSTTCPNC